jgi:hypothetical protein
VQLYSPAGGKLVDGQVQLGPGETETVAFGDSEAPLTRGWAELKSDDEFIATEFFQLFLGGLKPRVGVLPSPVAKEIRFLGFINDQIKSGLAVHNPSSTEATELTRISQGESRKGDFGRFFDAGLGQSRRCRRCGVRQTS